MATKETQAFLVVDKEFALKITILYSKWTK
jgi:hypothetical protein